MVKSLAFCGLLGLLPAQADACRLALILALDVSNSVDMTEDGLQRQGTAAALLSPDVQDAFFISSDPVALLVYEWSGQYHQTILSDWTLIETPADLHAVSGDVAQSVREQRDFPTALGAALAFASAQFLRGPSCISETIDVSGDGENNRGFGPLEAYAAFPFDGVTVNGLVIRAGQFESETALIPYFENNVLRGPGAFLEVADGFLSYEDTLKRKLLRELLAQIVGGFPQEGAPPG